MGLRPIKRQLKIPEKHLTFIYCVQTFVMVSGISLNPWRKEKRRNNNYVILLGTISEIDSLNLAGKSIRGNKLLYL